MGTVFPFDLAMQQGLVMNYTFVSAASALICDYLSMLSLEIRLIWFSKWTYTKVLFLIIRYAAFVGVGLLLRDQIAPNLSADECKVTYPMAVWFLIAQTFLAEVIFAIRVWAVWQRNKIVGIGLGCLTLTSIVTQCIIVNPFVKSIKFAPSPYQYFAGCFVVSAGTRSNSSIIYPILFTIVETVILMLMVISAIRSYRQGNKNTLTWVIHRDAILFYVFTLGISLMLLLPFPPLVAWSPMAVAIYSALTARMILNMRRVVNVGGSETELHSSNRLPVITPGQITFAPNGHLHELAIWPRPSSILEDSNCNDNAIGH